MICIETNLHHSNALAYWAWHIQASVLIVNSELCLEGSLSVHHHKKQKYQWKHNLIARYMLLLQGKKIMEGCAIRAIDWSITHDTT